MVGDLTTDGPVMLCSTSHAPKAMMAIRRAITPHFKSVDFRFGFSSTAGGSSIAASGIALGAAEGSGGGGGVNSARGLGG